MEYFLFPIIYAVVYIISLSPSIPILLSSPSSHISPSGSVRLKPSCCLPPPISSSCTSIYLLSFAFLEINAETITLWLILGWSKFWTICFSKVLPPGTTPEVSEPPKKHFIVFYICGKIRSSQQQHIWNLCQHIFWDNDLVNKNASKTPPKTVKIDKYFSDQS